jgi:ribosomal protein S18 acetylase RimI-like enzyme
VNVMEKRTRLNPYIRSIDIPHDIEAVMAIENASSDNPLTRRDIVRIEGQQHGVGMIAAHDGYVAGFCLYEMLRARIRIVHMVVAPGICRRGIGTAMIEKLKTKLTPESRRTGLSCVVRESNMAAALFLKSCGFEAVLAPGYFEDRPEDGYAFGFLVKHEPVLPAFLQSSQLTA